MLTNNLFPPVCKNSLHVPIKKASKTHTLSLSKKRPPRYIDWFWRLLNILKIGSFCHYSYRVVFVLCGALCLFSIVCIAMMLKLLMCLPLVGKSSRCTTKIHK